MAEIRGKVCTKVLTAVSSHLQQLKIVDNVLYVIMDEGDNLRVLRLSADGKALVPVEGIPDFDGETLVTEFWTKAHFEALKQASLAAVRP